MTIKALIFDVGGVLIRTESVAPREALGKRFGLGPWELHDVIFKSPLAEQATVGQVKDEAVWEQVRQQLKFPIEEMKQFQDAFWAGDVLDEPLVDWVASKRGQYRTGILSNAWPNARGFLTGLPKLAQAFETLVISAEEGLRKPHPEIYRRILNRLGVTGQEAVFVDDVLENIEAARQLGMTGLHYKPGLNVPQALADLGVA